MCVYVYVCVLCVYLCYVCEWGGASIIQQVCACACACVYMCMCVCCVCALRMCVWGGGASIIH